MQKYRIEGGLENKKKDQRRKIVSQHRSGLSKNANTHKLQLHVLVQRAMPTKPVLK